MANGRQRHSNPHPARGQGHEIGILVAVQPIRTSPLALGPDNAMAVKDHAIEQVENVARNDWAEGHEPPVLAEAVDAKRLGDDGREDAKEEAVPETRQARDEAQQVGVFDAEGAELGNAEDKAGNDEAPDTAGLQDLDQEVGSDAWGC